MTGVELVVGDGVNVGIADVLTKGAELGVWVTGCWFRVNRGSPGDT